MASQAHPEKKRYAVAIASSAPGTARFPELFMTTANISLEEQYRLTRTALVNAGLDMTASMDALTATGADGVISWNRLPLSTASLQENSTNGGLGIWPSSGA